MKKNRKKASCPYNPKARMVMVLENIAALTGGTLESIDDPKIKSELKRISEKLWKVVKQKSKKLTKEELSFVEAEGVIENVLYARDCLQNNLFPKKYLPPEFVRSVLKLGASALEFRLKFSMPPEEYEARKKFLRKLKRNQKNNRRE